MPVDDRLYSIAEVAQHLGMSPYTVTTWIKAGRLKASRIGRFWRIRPRDLERFIDDPPPLHPDRPGGPGGGTGPGEDRRAPAVQFACPSRADG